MKGTTSSFARVRASHYLSNTEPPGVCGDSGVSTPRLGLAGEGGRRGKNKGSKASFPGAWGGSYRALLRKTAGILFSNHREIRRRD